MLRHADGKWLCSEVICSKSLGYGKYIFKIDAPLDKLDPNVVLGLFTYEDKPEVNNREFDIEFSKWGKSNDLNSQFVVQPYQNKGNLIRYDSKLNGTYTAQVINWQSKSIEFQSIHGHSVPAPQPYYMIKSFKYQGKEKSLGAQILGIQ